MYSVQSNSSSVTSRTTAQITVTSKTLLWQSCSRVRLFRATHGQTKRTARQRHLGLDSSITRSRGDLAFKELALFALSSPLTNAHVERVLSQMSLVKSKPRNRTGQNTLSRILQCECVTQPYSNMVELGHHNVKCGLL